MTDTIRIQDRFNKALGSRSKDEPTQSKEATKQASLFVAKSANQWLEEASKRPIPKKLFSSFWFEGEVCILYADTNVGKSILAVQIADIISSSVSFTAAFDCEIKEPTKVLYFDFELSDKQFENRYSNNYKDHYKFAPEFIRIEINPDAEIPDGIEFEDYLSDAIEQTIKETGAKVIIVDNLTYLKNETEKARNALPLMKRLKALKNKYELSMLILAHTPKRDPSKPLSRNDLQGSRTLMQFCDSSFALGESYKDSTLRYLKQIKVRNTEFQFDSENVIVCAIKKENNFLCLDFVEYADERAHLKEQSEKEVKKLEQIITEMHQDGKSLRDIAKELNINHMKVSRVIKRTSEQQALEL